MAEGAGWPLLAISSDIDDMPRLDSAFWPGRILVDGKLLSMVESGEVEGLVVERAPSKTTLKGAITALYFDLDNANATYRPLEATNTQWQQDVWPFEVVTYSRDVADG